MKRLFDFARFGVSVTIRVGVGHCSTVAVPVTVGVIVAVAVAVPVRVGVSLKGGVSPVGEGVSSGVESAAGELPSVLKLSAVGTISADGVTALSSDSTVVGTAVSMSGGGGWHDRAARSRISSDEAK